MGSATVTIGGETRHVEEFTGRKGTWALKLAQRVLAGVPEIQAHHARFVRDYQDANTVELDRAQAKALMGARLEHMTEADWEQAGQKLRRPASPSAVEQVAAVFPMALDLAEGDVIRLLALMVTSNREVKSLGRAGGLLEHLDEVGAELLDDGLVDELLELAVVCAEVLQAQFGRAEDLGGRLGKIRAVPGMVTTAPRATSSETSSSPSSTSSSDSLTSSGGGSDEPSTVPVGVSSAASCDD